MDDAREVATKLQEYLSADYFAGAIRGVYTLINHVRFLEDQVASLKDTIAHMQEESE